MAGFMIGLQNEDLKVVLCTEPFVQLMLGKETYKGKARGFFFWNFFCTGSVQKTTEMVRSREEKRMGLAQNLRTIRQQKQLTQPALADKSGVSKGYVYMLESGDMTNPTLDILHKIAAALDCTIADLTGDPKVAPRTATEVSDSLMRFARQRKKAGEPLSEDDLMSLAQTRFRGKRPETVEDWAYVYEFLKRTFDG